MTIEPPHNPQQNPNRLFMLTGLFLHRVLNDDLRGTKTIDQHKQLFGIVSGMGGSQTCLCVALFILGGERNTHKQNSQNISGTCLDSSGTTLR